MLGSSTLYLLDSSSSHVLGMICLVGQCPWLYNCVSAVLETSGSFSYRLYGTACTSFKAQLKSHDFKEALPLWPSLPPPRLCPVHTHSIPLAAFKALTSLSINGFTELSVDFELIECVKPGMVTFGCSVLRPTLGHCRFLTKACSVDG